jgi:hypothetical protein
MCVDYAKGKIVCTPCHRYNLQIAGGVFTIDSNFARLRSRIADHLCGVKHIEAAWRTALQRKTDSINCTAGRNCARRALAVVHEHQSYLAYERLIAMVSAEGVEVGTLNHSAAFARNFVTSMYKAVIDGVERLLFVDPATGRKRAFAVVADKATVGWQTGQMVGLIILINGTKIPLLLSIEVVRAALAETDMPSIVPGSGKSLALELVATLVGGKPLALSREDVREQLTGLGFDGQYMGSEQGNSSGLDVTGKLCEILQMRRSWVLGWWDGAHMLELAIGDARKTTAWWLEFHVFISGVQSKFLYGKGFDSVFLAAAREMNSLGRADLNEAAEAQRTELGDDETLACAREESELPGNLGSGQWEVESILAERRAQSNGHNEFLVKWMGWAPRHNSWEKEADISPELVSAFRTHAND